MMKRKILFAALFVAGAVSLVAQTIRFVNLPYAEGTVYLQVKDGNKVIDQKIVEVTSDTLDVAVGFGQSAGKKVRIEAFQDLDGNRSLDFDGYGRPSEPCLQTEVAVSDSTTVICLELKQY